MERLWRPLRIEGIQLAPTNACYSTKLVSGREVLEENHFWVVCEGSGGSQHQNNGALGGSFCLCECPAQ